MHDAIPTLLDVARRATSIVRGVVSVIACFVAFHDEVATELARARRSAGSAEITFHRVAVARFSRIKLAVATRIGGGRAAGASRLSLARIRTQGVCGGIVIARQARFRGAIRIRIAEHARAETSTTLGTAGTGHRFADLTISDGDALIGTLRTGKGAHRTVIALLARRLLDNTISAPFDFTRQAAAVVANVVAVIAAFVSFLNSVTTQAALTRAATTCPAEIALHGIAVAAFTRI